MINKVSFFLLIAVVVACSDDQKHANDSAEEKNRKSEELDAGATYRDDSTASQAYFEDETPEPPPDPHHYYDENGVLNVFVDNVDSLYAHLQSNTHIYLESGTYYLDDIDSSIANPYASWQVVLFDEIIDDSGWDKDDQTLLITGVENLEISGMDEYGVEILTRKLSASVLAFQSCKNLVLKSLSLGHENATLDNKDDPWVSYCSGEVLEFFDCMHVELSYMDLFGCGTRGFLAHRCIGFNVEESKIHHCTYGAFGLFDSKNVSIFNCTLEDNLYRDFIEIENSQAVSMEYCFLANNMQADQYTEHVLSIDSTSSFTVSDIRYEANEFGPADLEGE